MRITCWIPKSTNTHTHTNAHTPLITGHEDPEDEYSDKSTLSLTLA